jgi:hypothetical protein
MSTIHRPTGPVDESGPGTGRPGLSDFEERLLAELKLTVAERAAPDGSRPGIREQATASRGGSRRRVPAGPGFSRARRLGLAGAVSAVAAAGVVVALAAAPGAPAGRSAAPGAPASRPAASFVPAATVADVLHNAAVAALRLPARTPRPNQFVYTKVEEKNAILSSNGSSLAVTREWASVSGAAFGFWQLTPLDAATRADPYVGARASRTAACVNGRLKVPSKGSSGSTNGQRCSPSLVSGYFPQLPTHDPAALARYLLKGYQSSPDDEAGNLLNVVWQLMSRDYLTPPQLAALYNMLARTPTLTMVPQVRNIEGTAGVGIRSSLDKGLYTTVIFNPRTFAPVGMILHAPVKESGMPQNGGETLLKLAFVSKAGQLP